MGLPIGIISKLSVQKSCAVRAEVLCKCRLPTPDLAVPGVPAAMAVEGQTLPSGGRSTNDRSRTVSGSPSVESRASAQRR